MVNEFISLLESEKEKTLEVLRPHIAPEILKYFVGGFLDNDEKRLIGYSLMPVNKAYYYRYGYLFENFEHGYMSSMSADISEKTRRYLNKKKTTFQNKSIQECIEEGLYRFNLISFTGEFDFNEWNILTSCCFTDEKDKLQIWKMQLSRVQTPYKNYFFNQSIFEETQKRHEVLIDILKKDVYPLSTDMQPFIGHSQLVALIRSDKKRVVNSLYESYIKKAVFEPFAIKLQTYYPNIYHTIKPIWIDRCDLIYPDHKQFCLMLFFAFKKSNTAILKCFLYNQQENQICNWSYFPSISYHKNNIYLENIIDLFKPISKLDNMDYFYDVKCTLDDDDFWNNYVFKKDGNKFVYLKKIEFEN